MKIASLTLALVIALPLAAQVKLTKKDGAIDVDINGKPFTTLYYGGKAPKPYMHPLRAASGTIVTRGFPMEKIEGESRDHQHHRGLWFTHGEVNGFNFWENEDSYNSSNRGHVVLDKMDKVEGGKDKGVIDATFNWQDPKGKTIMTEHRVTTFYSDPVNRIVDFDITLKAVDEVKFADTKEGTFAIRLADALSEKKGGTMTNASGATKMKNVWGKPSPWVDYAGEINGEKVGVAIFDHPSNPHHPTTWHARDYGLFAANIFGKHDFMNDKSQDGSLTLKPGETLRFRYRVLIHPGDTASANIAKLYEAYK